MSENDEIKLVQECAPDYLKSDDFMLEPRRLYKVDHPSARFYYSVGEDLTVNRYVSVTTLLHILGNPGLQSWMIEKGREYHTILRETAEYGTFYHATLAQLMLEGSINLEPHAIRERINQWVDEKAPWINPHSAYCDSSSEKGSWYELLAKDILCWLQFVADRNPEVLAIEIRLASDDMGIAGALDYVLRMDFNKKRVVGILDVKRAISGFWPSHAQQLHLYKKLFDETYATDEEVMLFNWRPKSWTSAPTYELKNQTDETTAASIANALLPFVPIMWPKDSDRNIIQTTGIAHVGQPVNDNFTNTGLMEIIRRSEVARRERG